MARVDIERLRHPSANEVWFHALSEEQREELTRRFRDDLRHTEGLVQAERRRWAVEALQTGVLFAGFDALFLGYASLDSAIAAFCVGLFLGGVFVGTDAKRVLSGALGMVAVLAFTWWTRGGLNPQLLFAMLPFGGLCAWLGWKRETRFS